MPTYSSTHAWRISWTEKPEGYSPWGCKQLDITEVTWHSTLESFLITFSSSPDGSYTASLGSGLWKTELQLLSEPEWCFICFYPFISFFPFLLSRDCTHQRKDYSKWKQKRSKITCKGKKPNRIIKCRTWVGTPKTIYTTVYTLTPLSYDWPTSSKNMTFLIWP